MSSRSIRTLHVLQQIKLTLSL